MHIQAPKEISQPPSLDSFLCTARKLAVIQISGETIQAAEADLFQGCFPNPFPLERESMIAPQLSPWCITIQPMGGNASLNIYGKRSVIIVVY